jgi:hypothetical protein
MAVLVGKVMIWSILPGELHFCVVISNAMLSDGFQ